jgi:hypothetical protein
VSAARFGVVAAVLVATALASRADVRYERERIRPGSTPFRSPTPFGRSRSPPAAGSAAAFASPAT